MSAVDCLPLALLGAGDVPHVADRTVAVDAILGAVAALGTPPSDDAAAGLHAAVMAVRDLACDHCRTRAWLFAQAVQGAREHRSFAFSFWFRNGAWTAIAGLRDLPPRTMPALAQAPTAVADRWRMGAVDMLGSRQLDGAAVFVAEALRGGGL